ncbi:MAG: ABC transporter substrate-binding protein [Chloroflexota bacterium]
MSDRVSNKRYVTRRSLLQIVGVAGLGLLQACAPNAQPTPAPTAAKAGTQAPATAAPAAQATQAPAAASTQQAGPKRGGTFTVARTATLQDFDPLRGGSGTYPMQRGLYNSLLHYDAQLTPQPELAEKWDFSADGKTLTLKLRQGVKFHSGREFTADDVKFSAEYGAKAQHAPMLQSYLTIKGIETPDKYTIVFKFDTVNPSIFDLLDVFWILDKDAVGGLASGEAGTGPFKLDKYVPNDRIEMVAFKDYWDKGKPYVDRLVVRQVPDAVTLAINLESSAVDCIWQANYGDLVRLGAAGGKYAVDPGARGSQMHNIALNVKFGPLQNKKVRQAIAWSIDRSRFCKTTLQGLVEPTALIWPPHSWAYAKDLEGKIGYDLDKAKALLKEGGAEGGFEAELLTSTKESTSFGELATMLQSDLKKIGINVKVTDTDSALYNSRLTKGDIQMAVHQYGRANRDPGTTLTGAKSWYMEKDGGWTHYESDEWVRVRNEMQSTMDRAKRQAAARRIQEMALDECFTNVVAETPGPWARASYVKGLAYDFNNAPFTGDVWLDK